ncbi:MAG TPA: ATP-binding protein [Candidatus Wirthbacteria bacterium]|nr:ATP-binding protein [Candidatus Wirthbacteria bacterium]
MYPRTLQNTIQNQLGRGRIIILYGPRQAGKTTLVQNIISTYPPDQSLYLDCDLLRVRQLLEHQDEIKLKEIVQRASLVVIDEAQRVKDIGLILKIMHTYLPKIQIIATGSSSFELANSIHEPLTGRAIDYLLLPLSYEEILSTSSPLDLPSQLESLLKYGSYPGIIDLSGSEKELQLQKLTSNYLYKDILELDKIRKPDQLTKLLQLLALQIGQEVSYAEIGRQLGLNTATIQRYLDLLEKTYVIFQLKAFSRNLHKEISKSSKIYFWDLGIRNALLNNFNPLDLRLDKGAIWENYCLSERLKLHHYHQIFANHYFWRTYDQQEIDLIEESKGQIRAFEFKYSPRKKAQAHKAFAQAYPGSTYQTINTTNLADFLSAS